MIIEQLVAGGAQFTGTGNAGLVDWNTGGTAGALCGIGTNVDETIVIQSLALETEELIPEIFCRFSAPGENIATTLRRVTILRPRTTGTITAQPTAGFSFAGCGIYVPRWTTVGGVVGAAAIGANAGIWNLVLTTVGKTLDARLIVEFTKGVKPGKIPQR